MRFPFGLQLLEPLVPPPEEMPNMGREEVALATVAVELPAYWLIAAPPLSAKLPAIAVLEAENDSSTQRLSVKLYAKGVCKTM